MNQDLKEKKLLVLGAYDTEKEIISEAHLMGVYVIVTDNHENWDDAPAKKVADEAWNISWSDIKTLSKKCIDEHVDGIMAGFSEKRIHCAQLLCEILNKPFYANGAKLDVIIDKILFKQACINSGVTVPKSYKYGDFVEYPVIVKPSDNGGSRGITVCYSQEEFIPAYQKALDASDNKSVVIEQYFVADETMIYFTVHNGIVDVMHDLIGFIRGVVHQVHSRKAAVAQVPGKFRLQIGRLAVGPAEVHVFGKGQRIDFKGDITACEIGGDFR